MSDSEVDLNELVARNAQVDPSQLDEAWEALATLRQAGLTGPSYRLDLPYERGPVEPETVLADDEIEDGRSLAS